MAAAGRRLWDRQELHLEGVSNHSKLMCSMGENEVVIKDRNDKSLKVANVAIGQAIRPQERDFCDQENIVDIVSCSSLPDGRFVCGTSNGRIMVHHSHWSLVTTFPVRKDIAVTVTMDGRIQSAVVGSSDVVIFHPNGEKIDGGFSVGDRRIRSLHALGDGITAIEVSDNRGPDVLIYRAEIGSRAGKTGRLTRGLWENMDVIDVATSFQRDTMYVLIRDVHQGICTIDKWSLPHRKVSIARFKASGPVDHLSICGLNSNKTLVHDCGKLLVFRSPKI